MRHTPIWVTATVLCGLASPAVTTLALAQSAPPVSLAQTYTQTIRLSQYWVSEKLDGARAWWDGTHLLSRNGNIFHAPEWFTAALPDTVLDGELWMGRGQFQRLMQTIRDTVPDEDAWRQVVFMVFDAPQVTGQFSHRQQLVTSLIAKHDVPWLAMVEQRRVSDHNDMQMWLKQVVSAGGEGLILQHEDSLYQSGRHAGMLKLKTHQDAEARVIGYVGGRGKYRGLTGSLVVVDANGLQFKLGSGLSDDQRRSPPPVGAMVSYRFQGRTQSGKPRFARFLRIRPAE